MKSKITSLVVLLFVALLGVQNVLASIEDCCASKGTLALTFDEGPSPNTGDLLTVLDQVKVKATFHIVVRYLTNANHISIVRQIVAKGHDIGIRVDPQLENNMRAEYVVKSLNNNANFLEKQLKFRPKFVRLPYGSGNASLVKSIEQAGFVVTQPNLDSGDYQNGATVDDIVNVYEMQLGNAPDGAGSFISAQRDMIRNSVLAVPQIVQTALENGYKIVKMSECLGVSGGNKQQGGVDNDVPHKKKGGKNKNKSNRSNKSNLSGRKGKKHGKKDVSAFGDSNDAETMFAGKIMGCLLLVAGSLVALL